MSQLVAWNAQTFLSEITAMEEAARKLANTKHYSKLGAEGVFAILQMARVVKMDPLWALNDGMYYAQGRVGLYAKACTMMIRSAGHSISKDSKSTSTCVILHGRRADNGDTCTVMFSVEMARQAGVYKAGGPWDKWSEDMCFARCASRLSKQLFSDCTGGLSVEEKPYEAAEDVAPEPAIDNPISVEQLREIEAALGDNKRDILTIKGWAQVKELSELRCSHYATVLKMCRKFNTERIDSVKQIDLTPSQEVKDLYSSNVKPIEEPIKAESFSDKAIAPSVFDDGEAP